MIWIFHTIAFSQPQKEVGWTISWTTPWFGVGAAPLGGCIFYHEDSERSFPIQNGRLVPVEWVGVLPDYKRRTSAKFARFSINHNGLVYEIFVGKTPQYSIKEPVLRSIAGHCPANTLSSEKWIALLEVIPKKGRKWLIAYFIASALETQYLQDRTGIDRVFADCISRMNSACAKSVESLLDQMSNTKTQDK